MGLPLKPLYTQRIINEQKKQQNIINIPLNDENKHQHIQTLPQISNVSFLTSSSVSSNIGHSNHERNDDYDNCTNLWCEQFAPTESNNLLDFGNNYAIEQIKAFLNEWKRHTLQLSNKNKQNKSPSKYNLFCYYNQSRQQYMSNNHNHKRKK